MALRRDGKGESGAASVEYAGVYFVVVVIVAALLLSVAPAGYAIMAKICEAFGTSCANIGPEARAKELNIPCITNQTDRTLGYNVNAYYVRAERKDTDKILVKNDGSASVTLTQGSGVGLEASKKSGGKAVDASARIVANGDLGYIYNFPKEYGGKGSAESFLGDRRSGVNQAIDIVVPGAQTVREGLNQAGHGIKNAWDWGTSKLGFGPSDEEKAAQARQQAMTTPDAMQVTLGLQGTGTVSIDGGLVKGSGELSGGVQGQVVVALNEDGPDKAVSSFTGSAKYDLKGNLTLGVPGDARQGIGDIPPILNLNGQLGQTASYKVVFDKDGQPSQLVTTIETRQNAGLGLDPKIGRGGAAAKANSGTLTQESTTLDLTVPENRKAFDGVFTVYGVSVGGKDAKVADINTATVFQNWGALQARQNADGYEVTYSYDTYGDQLSAKGKTEKDLKAGGFGVGGEKTSSSMALTNAVARDNRYGGAEAPLATCKK